MFKNNSSKMNNRLNKKQQKKIYLKHLLQTIRDNKISHKNNNTILKSNLRSKNKDIIKQNLVWIQTNSTQF